MTDTNYGTQAAPDDWDDVKPGDIIEFQQVKKVSKGGSPFITRYFLVDEVRPGTSAWERERGTASVRGMFVSKNGETSQSLNGNRDLYGRVSQSINFDRLGGVQHKLPPGTPTPPKPGSREAKIARLEQQIKQQVGRVSLAREARANTGARIQSNRESKANAKLSELRRALQQLRQGDSSGNPTPQKKAAEAAPVTPDTSAGLKVYAAREAGRAAWLTSSDQGERASTLWAETTGGMRAIARAMTNLRKGRDPLDGVDLDDKHLAPIYQRKRRVPYTRQDLADEIVRSARWLNRKQDQARPAGKLYRGVRVDRDRVPQPGDIQRGDAVSWTNSARWAARYANDASGPNGEYLARKDQTPVVYVSEGLPNGVDVGSNLVGQMAGNHPEVVVRGGIRVVKVEPYDPARHSEIAMSFDARNRPMIVTVEPVGDSGLSRKQARPLAELTDIELTRMRREADESDDDLLYEAVQAEQDRRRSAGLRQIGEDEYVAVQSKTAELYDSELEAFLKTRGYPRAVLMTREKQLETIRGNEGLVRQMLDWTPPLRDTGDSKGVGRSDSRRPAKRKPGEDIIEQTFDKYYRGKRFGEVEDPSYQMVEPGGDRLAFLDYGLTGLARDQGWGLPGVGTEKQVQAKIDQGWIEVWRGVTPSFDGDDSRVESGTIMDGLRHDPDYKLGTGIYGNGIYTSVNRLVADSFGNKASTDAGYRGTVVRMAIDPQAKIIDYDQAVNLKMKMQAKYRAELARNKGEDLSGVHGFIDLTNDPGRAMALLGYDAIRVPAGSSDGGYDPQTGSEVRAEQYNVLNRGILLIEEVDR